jgi:hypothetical protein
MIRPTLDKAKGPVSDSTSAALHGPRFESDPSNALASGRIERLLQGANEAIALPHRLRLIDLEARHRLAQYRSHYNPNQPRVPAGNPDGGQWTAAGGGTATRLAAADTPRPGRRGVIAIALQLALRAIEAYRLKERLWDLFGNKEGVIAVTTIDGENIFGTNSESRVYTSADFAAAKKLRDTLMKKYPTKFIAENLGQAPNNALFHAETTVLLRAAKRAGGTLAGRTLTIYGDTRVCPNCKQVLPYVGLELGNPTVKFVDPDGSARTMQNGSWVKEGAE